MAESLGSAITVEQFLELAQDSLELEFAAGQAYTDNEIRERSLNRPGLIFAGFEQYFAQKRVQVMGLAELSYLKSLSEEVREKALQRFFSSGIPCVIVTRNRRCSDRMIRLAEEYKIPLMRSPLITMDLISTATVILDNLMSPRVQVHGTMVDILGIGVLLEGDPGIGKSETALALIERGHSLVSDDATVLRLAAGNQIIGSSVHMTRHHMEIRGLGIIHVPSLFGVASMRDSKKLHMVIRLVTSDKLEKTDRTGLDQQQRSIMGVSVPYCELPVAEGRDMAHVVEVAALNQKLKMLGRDAAKELDEKLVSILSKQTTHE